MRPPKDSDMKRAQTWDIKLCLWPRKCFLTGKRLWMKYAYKGTRIITGPGDPVVYEYWVERSEFIFWNLRREQ